jgi:hypothetical protein
MRPALATVASTLLAWIESPDRLAMTGFERRFDTSGSIPTFLSPFAT